MSALGIIVQTNNPLKVTAVGEIAAANIIPALLVAKPTGNGVGEKEATAKKVKKLKAKKKLLDKLI